MKRRAALSAYCLLLVIFSLIISASLKAQTLLSEFVIQDNISSSLKRHGKGGYRVIDQGRMYFVSFAVVEWVDVFSRKDYRDLVIESLKYCQEKKGLLIYAWCIMSNHVHLIISAKESNVSDVR